MRIARLNQLYSKTINFTSYNLNFANLTNVLSFSLLRALILIEHRMLVKGLQFLVLTMKFELRL